MGRAASTQVFRFIVALAIVFGLALFYREALPQVNQTTVGFSFLLAILAVSALWGMAVSAVMSVAAMLTFNFFFLPPIGTFTIADPQNWVALFAFLVTAIVGSQLSVRIRKEADAANQRRREIERAYVLSQKLLDEGNVILLLNAIPKQFLRKDIKPLNLSSTLIGCIGFFAYANGKMTAHNRGHQERKKSHPILRIGNRKSADWRQEEEVESQHRGN